MMQWYWKVRIYNHLGNYACGQIATPRDLKYIETIQNFYTTLTGFQMILEGMSETKSDLAPIEISFKSIWKV